jgi:hypothetical protein
MVGCRTVVGCLLVGGWRMELVGQQVSRTAVPGTGTGTVVDTLPCYIGYFSQTKSEITPPHKMNNK